MVGEIGEAVTEYICVLCGSALSSADYTWGPCADARPGSSGRRCDWSCPQCGGVVVEYARGRTLTSKGESILVGPRA